MPVGAVQTAIECLILAIKHIIVAEPIIIAQRTVVGEAEFPPEQGYIRHISEGVLHGNIRDIGDLLPDAVKLMAEFMIDGVNEKFLTKTRDKTVISDIDKVAGRDPCRNNDEPRPPALLIIESDDALIVDIGHEKPPFDLPHPFNGKGAVLIHRQTKISPLPHGELQPAAQRRGDPAISAHPNIRDINLRAQRMRYGTIGDLGIVQHIQSPQQGRIAQDIGNIFLRRSVQNDATINLHDPLSKMAGNCFTASSAMANFVR